MAKTLVIAEKPSVGQDLARVLPGPFKEESSPGDGTTRWLEGPEHVISWAVGHLAGLAEPAAYNPRYKKWRMADLPIIPNPPKLVVVDERAGKQMSVLKALLHREDIDQVINACDAAREGELIFAYIYELAGATKPVQRLWLQSMTELAMRQAIDHLRPGSDLAELEAAARSRSEADWIVGMNATRAATIRLRKWFKKVPLGRVQTPTLAILTRREEERRSFVPEKYWLVDAHFATDDDRQYPGRYHIKTQPRIASREEAEAVVDAVRGQPGQITKLEKSEKHEIPPLLYDLTSLQRDANTRFGFTARRTLAAAQRCYDEHKALTYPRTNSRFLTSDMVSEIKSTAARVGEQSEYAAAAQYVASLESLPIERSVDDEKVRDHHAIIPTNAPHDLQHMNSDDRRVYDLVARRFLAVFHPDSVSDNTRVVTTVAGHLFRTSGKVIRVPGWRSVYGELAEVEDDSEAETDEERDQRLPSLERGEAVSSREVSSAEKETKPPALYTDASLLRVMETAGKLVDDDELREAMKDSGIGTPATRAEIIEGLIKNDYVQRNRRALVPTEKGMHIIRILDELAGGHVLTSAEMTGNWEQRLARIESGEEVRTAFMGDITEFAKQTVDKLGANLTNTAVSELLERLEPIPPCPDCGKEVNENSKAYSCWRAPDDPGCGFSIWKDKAGKQLPRAVARELIETGRTTEPVTGFKGRSGRTFPAHLKLLKDDSGKWRVEFDEPWAQDGGDPPPERDTQKDS